MSVSAALRPAALLCLLPLVGACNRGLTSEEELQTVLDSFLPTLAKVLDAAIGAKDDAAPGANITPIVVSGDADGQLTISGSVAESSGLNSQMTLSVAFEDYSDDGALVWLATAAPLGLSLGVTNAPADNRMDGRLDGPIAVGGLVAGDGTLDLDLASDLADDDEASVHLCTRATGTMGVGEGSLAVDVVVPIDAPEADWVGCGVPE